MSVLDSIFPDSKSGSKSCTTDNLVAVLLVDSKSGNILMSKSNVTNALSKDYVTWMQELTTGKNLFQILNDDDEEESSNSACNPQRWRDKLIINEDVIVPLKSRTRIERNIIHLSMKLLDNIEMNSQHEYIIAQIRSDAVAVSLSQQQQLQREMIAIADSAFDSVIMANEQGTIIFCNKSTEILFQWTREEMIGQNVSMICGGNHAEHHQSYIQSFLQTGHAQTMGIRREVSARKKDGTEFPVALGLKEILHDHGETTERCFVSYITDLSQTRRHEEEIECRERQSQALIDSSFDPIIQINEKGIITVVNEAAIHLFGWTRDEFIGSNISMICGGVHAERHDEYLLDYMATGQKHVIGQKRKVTARRKDGSEFPIELGVQQVKTLQGEYYFCGFIRDLTETNLMRFNMMKQQDLIKETFFEGGNRPVSAPNTPEHNASQPTVQTTRSGRPLRLRGMNSSVQ